MNTKQFFTSLSFLAADSQAFIKNNKSSLFTTGAVLLIIINLVIIKGILSALHAIPLLPSVMELVGVGYSVWFSARFLYSKSGRSELVDTFKGIRAEVLGESTADSETSIITECDIPSIPSPLIKEFTDAHQELAMIELLQERGYKVYTKEECIAIDQEFKATEQLAKAYFNKEADADIDSPRVLETSVLFEFLEETGWTSPTMEQDAVLDAITSDEAYNAELAKILYERVSATSDVTVYSQALQDWYRARKEEREDNT